MFLRPTAVLLVCLVALFGGGVGSAWASSLRVSPVTLELPAGRKAATLTLSTDQPEVSVQIRVFRWTQADGVEQLERTDAVVVSPPAVTLKAGVEQVVRVVRPAAAPTTEESYRILVDELPDPRRQAETGVAFVMRQSIPVFFTPAAPAKAALTWRIRPSSGGGFELAGMNQGRRRLRLAEMSLADPSGKPVGRWPGLAGYVLPGATMTWKLPEASLSAPLALTAQSDGGPIRVTVSPPPAS